MVWFTRKTWEWAASYKVFSIPIWFKIRLLTHAPITMRSRIWFKLSDQGATLPHVTRKVTQYQTLFLACVRGSGHEINSRGQLDWHLVQVCTSASRSPLRLAHHTRLLANLFILPMPGCTCISHSSWITRSLPGGRTTTLAPQSTQPSSTLNYCLL